MGLILTRFRKKRTTLEILQELDDRIKDIKHRRVTAEQRKRVIVGRLMLYSAAIYILAALWFYFRSFPSTLKEQAFHILPFLGFPLVVVLIRWSVAWYFRRKIVRSELELRQKEKLKQEILEEVMDKETYKSAKEILDKFAPAESKSQMVPLSATRTLLPKSPAAEGSELRRRPVGPPPAPPTSSLPKPPPSLLRPSPPPPQQRLSPAGAGPPLPRPIYPRERTVVDRLVDFLIADGPANRYALVCKNCLSHNGMALKEEFEYLAFRCCYCFTVNPARKQRPQAPKIEDVKPPANDATSSSEPDSAATTSDDEEQPPPPPDAKEAAPDEGPKPDEKDPTKAAAEEEKREPVETTVGESEQ